MSMAARCSEIRCSLAFVRFDPTYYIELRQAEVDEHFHWRKVLQKSSSSHGHGLGDAVWEVSPTSDFNLTFGMTMFAWIPRITLKYILFFTGNVEAVRVRTRNSLRFLEGKIIAFENEFMVAVRWLQFCRGLSWPCLEQGFQTCLGCDFSTSVRTAHREEWIRLIALFNIPASRTLTWHVDSQFRQVLTFFNVTVRSVRLIRVAVCSVWSKWRFLVWWMRRCNVHL